MNLVADESIDRQIVDQLRNDGHTVYSVARNGACFIHSRDVAFWVIKCY